jgi:2-amino-4-hydroxy-6-hydroxymethyldihydropteridine diphosphokinase
MRAVLVGVGTNLGAREAAIRAATGLLGERDAITVERVSPIYETAPLGPPQGNYLNAALRIRTSLTPVEVLRELLRVERRLGRVRSSDARWGPRSIDLDLLWDELGKHESPELRVPHPELEHRAFVLAPMLDVAPELRDTYSDALQRVGGPPSKWERQSSVEMRFSGGLTHARAEADSLVDACALCVSLPAPALRARSTRHLTLDASPEDFARVLRDLFRTGFVVQYATLSHCSNTQWIAQFHGVNTGFVRDGDVRLQTTSGDQRDFVAMLEIRARPR